jgi:AraC family transcriptional regulator
MVMTELTSIPVPGRMLRDELTLQTSLRSPDGPPKRGRFQGLRDGISHSSAHREEHGIVEVAPWSSARLQTVVDAILTALRSLLEDDRESAEVSIDRAAEMLVTAGGAGVSAPTLDCPKSDEVLRKNRGGLAPWQIRRVAAHVESHLDGPIVTRDLAAVAKLSPCHFARAFRQSLGEPPHEYITRRRVERAQGLMLTTRVTLGRIAADCGLADQSHLNRVFRRLVGESPGAWRRARMLQSG